jgi:hypothetical protein
MNEDRSVRPGVILVVLIVGWLLMRPLCTPRVVIPPDPNVELVRTTRDAMEMMRDAQDELTAMRRASEVWYFVGWGIAVALPVGIALLLLRYHAQTPVDEAEVLMQLEEMQPDLLALPEAKPNELPSPTEAAAESDPEAEDKPDAEHKPDADAPEAGHPCP